MQILKSTKQQKLKSIESIFPKELQNNEIKKFQQLEMIKSFGNSIVIGKMTLAKASKKQSSLLQNILELINRARPNI